MRYPKHSISFAIRRLVVNVIGYSLQRIVNKFAHWNNKIDPLLRSEWIDWLYREHALLHEKTYTHIHHLRHVTRWQNQPMALQTAFVLLADEHIAIGWNCMVTWHNSRMCVYCVNWFIWIFQFIGSEICVLTSNRACQWVLLHSHFMVE